MALTINPDGSINFESGLAPSGAGGARAATAGTDLAASNRAARIAKYGADQVARMEAAGSRFGGATSAAPSAPSTPTPTSPAPVAAAEAERGLSFGQRVLRRSRIAGRVAGVAVGGAQVALGINQARKGQYGDAATNIPLGAATAVSPGVGFLGSLVASGRDTIMRAVIDRIYGQNPATAPTPELQAYLAKHPEVVARANATFKSGTNPVTVPAQTTGAAAAAPAGTATSRGNVTYTGTGSAPQDIQDAINKGTPLPSGTGYAVGPDGRVIAVRNGAQAAPGNTFHTPAAAPATEAPVVLPSLSTSGGIFSALANFQKRYAGVAGATANKAARSKSAKELAALLLKTREVGAKELSARGTLLRGAAAVAGSQQAGKKVVTDLQGNPIIVDTIKNSALKPNVGTTSNVPVNDATIKAESARTGLSIAEVRRRLKEAGRL